MIARRIVTKKGSRIDITYRHATSDVNKNYGADEAKAVLEKALNEGFRNAVLMTTEADLHLSASRGGAFRLKAAKPTHSTAPKPDHDRHKTRPVDPDARYLKELGITDENGRIIAKQRDKWVQINRFVEIVAEVLAKVPHRDERRLRIVDMGSGKGYLTFALYDHAMRTLPHPPEMIGIEARQELVDLCNRVAERCGFEGLRFVRSTIVDFDAAGTDILIALHACDTATDDAIFKGIIANSSAIIVAPCCHKEVRGQMRIEGGLGAVLKHGLLAERTAESVTDGLRSLILEREGYSTRMIDFVSGEHTPKNTLITAVRATSGRPAATQQIAAVRRDLNISTLRLDDLLAAEILD